MVDLAKPRIAYLGIGLMGLPMTRRLLSLGYRVTVFDIAPAQIEAARAAGAETASSPAQAVSGADLVLVNLPTPDAVEAAVFGTGAAAGMGAPTPGTSAASTMQPPQLLIDFSTIKVKQGRDFAARLKQATGCAWIDTPVSGWPPASASGRLTIMCGGDKPADIERIRPLMQDVSQRFTHMGPMGSGLAAKMLNQLIVGSLHVVLAEARRWPKQPASTPRACPSAWRAAMPTGRCFRAFTRAWCSGISRRKAMCAS